MQGMGILIMGLLALIYNKPAYPAACSTISRNNNSANSILTSSKYNTDVNTVYTEVNKIYNGSCTLPTDSLPVITKSELSATDFQALFYSVKDGCEVTYDSPSQVNVAPCRLAVNGDWVNKTASSTIGFGDGGNNQVSGEIVSQVYYVYAKDGSSGTGLHFVVDVTAPSVSFGELATNATGSFHKALGSFYNDNNSNIASNSVQSWVNHKFNPERSAGFFGSVKWESTTNCRWVGTSTSYTDYPADSDCDDTKRTVKGIYNTSGYQVGHVDGRQPQILFSFMPKGHYRIVGRGRFLTNAQATCKWRFSDGTNSTVTLTAGKGGAAEDINFVYLDGSIDYLADQTNVTLIVQHDKVAGTACDIYLAGDASELEIAVYYSPFAY